MTAVLIRLYQLAVMMLALYGIRSQGTLHNGQAIGFTLFLSAWFATAIPIWTYDRAKALVIRVKAARTRSRSRQPDAMPKARMDRHASIGSQGSAGRA